jgi:hypothetical protein
LAFDDNAMFRAADLEPGSLEPLKAGAGAGGTSPQKKLIKGTFSKSTSLKTRCIFTEGKHDFLYSIL